MDDDGQAEREYQRLRSEIAAFVVDALAERATDGSQPELNERLIAAIDARVEDVVQRRVEDAVAARIDAIEWPDADSFADAVAAALSRREPASPRRDESRSKVEAPKRRATGSSFAESAGLVAVAVVVGGLTALALWWFFLRPVPNGNIVTGVVNQQTGTIIYENEQRPADNAAAPTNQSEGPANGQVPGL